MQRPEGMRETATNRPPLTTGERIVQATLEHRLVRLRYQGNDRTVEPHLVGVHEAGEPILVGYQTAGASRRGDVPGWRTLITTELEAVELLDQTFPGPRPDLNVAAYPMVEIFARA